jgi:hypothetical protein
MVKMKKVTYKTEKKRIFYILKVDYSVQSSAEYWKLAEYGSVRCETESEEYDLRMIETDQQCLVFHRPVEEVPDGTIDATRWQ